MNMEKPFASESFRDPETGGSVFGELNEERIQYNEVDRKAPEILNALKEASVYRKKVEVQTRSPKDGNLREQYEELTDSVKKELKAMKFDPDSLNDKYGELVITRLDTGKLETPNIAVSGDVIVRNPGGEEYVLKQEKFVARYEPTNTEGVYRAKGFSRIIKNPFGKPIQMMASWGQMQTGDADCMIADVCDAQGNNMEGEPYIIQSKAFEDTFALV